MADNATDSYANELNEQAPTHWEDPRVSIGRPVTIGHNAFPAGTPRGVVDDAIQEHCPPGVEYRPASRSRVATYRLHGDLADWVREHKEALAQDQGPSASSPGWWSGYGTAQLTLTGRDGEGEVYVHAAGDKYHDKGIMTPDEIVPTLVRSALSRVHPHARLPKHKAEAIKRMLQSISHPVPSEVEHAIGREDRERQEAAELEREWASLQEQAAPHLPRGYTHSIQRDLRGTPPPGVVWTRPAYRKGSWSRPAATKRGRSLTVEEMRRYVAQLNTVPG